VTCHGQNQGFVGARTPSTSTRTGRRGRRCRARSNGPLRGPEMPWRSFRWLRLASPGLEPGPVINEPGPFSDGGPRALAVGETLPWPEAPQGRKPATQTRPGKSGSDKQPRPTSSPRTGSCHGRQRADPRGRQTPNRGRGGPPGRRRAVHQRPANSGAGLGCCFRCSFRPAESSPARLPLAVWPAKAEVSEPALSGCPRGVNG